MRTHFSAVLTALFLLIDVALLQDHVASQKEGPDVRDENALSLSLSRRGNLGCSSQRTSEGTRKRKGESMRQVDPKGECVSCALIICKLRSLALTVLGRMGGEDAFEA